MKAQQHPEWSTWIENIRNYGQPWITADNKDDHKAENEAFLDYQRKFLCPRCKAKPGKPCRTPRGKLLSKYRHSHVDRTSKPLEALHEEAERSEQS